ncbi:MAG: hypothetical protein FJW36_16390 [Acidobacteria bacterium]|nr:hypothetical protein [Acidobacteriota bacterium]
MIRVDSQKPETLMAVAMRGTAVFRSRDAAAHWTLLTSFPELPNARLDCGFLIPGKWFVGAAPGGLWVSTDEGDHWQVVPGTAKLSVYAINAWPKDSRVLAIGTNQGVWMSNDAGSSWRRISPPTIADLAAIVSVAFDPEKAGTIYAGTPHLPWKTTNAGTSWQKAHVGMYDDSDIFSIAVDPTRTGRIFASACSGIYCSLNAGGAWRRVQGIPGNNRRTYVVAQSPHKADLLFAGTSAGMWTSRDGGMNWKKLNEFVATSISFHPKDAELFFISTERHGLQRTSNGGTSFTAVNEGFASRSIAAVADGETGLKSISQYDGSFVKSSPEGAWTRIEPEAVKTESGDWFETAVDPSDRQVLLRASRSGLAKSVDSGKTWRLVQQEWIQSVVFHPKQKGLCFALRQQRVFWSPDSGENWYWLPAQEDSHLRFEKLYVAAAWPGWLVAVSPHRGLYLQKIPQSVKVN